MRGDPAKQLRLFQELDSPAFLKETANGPERQRIEEKFAPLMREELRLGQLVSYAGNKTIPVLRLYRYKEAFASSFVKEFIDRFSLTRGDYLFDPFCGMGTTLFTAMQCDVPAIGIDKLPIATFVAQTLPLFFLIEPQALRETFETLKARVAEAEPAEIALDVRIMKVAFPEDTLLALRRWKGVIDLAHTLNPKWTPMTNRLIQWLKKS